MKPRLRCQAEIRYVQTVPDGKCLYPDPHRQNVPMSRLSCFQKSPSPEFCAFKNAYFQSFVRSKRIFVRSKIDNLCVQKTLCPDFCAFNVQSKIIFSRLPCVQNCLCREFFCVPDESLFSPKLIIYAFMVKLSCVQKTLCPDFHKIVMSNFVRSKSNCVRSNFDIVRSCPDNRFFEKTYVEISCV